MDFSEALIACKLGSRIQREGWNGKGMYVTYQPGYPNGIGINENTAKATNLSIGTICKFLPYLMMKTADINPTFVPWLASQTDILAGDWVVLLN